MPSQTGPGWDGHGGQRGYLANRRDGPRPYPQAPQPGFARHAEDYYQASSHRLASGPAAFPPGDGYHGYRGYPEAPPPPFAQPAESYELVEVRDRRGDYLVKRPVPRGDAVFPHPGRVPEPAYPPYGPVYGDGLRQMSHPDPRRPAAAYAGPGPSSSVGREEYDPRYPAAD
ncbi:hypothetical protein CDD83_1130 [Cordyceps sp. RAO-2017]|nr:hypothetical protein CDD83_1130 [Cordyceps sp. RAO-2017]